MKKYNIRTFLLFIAVAVLATVLLTSCSGSKYGQRTLYLEENQSTTSSCFARSGSSVTKLEWLQTKIETGSDENKAAINNIKDEIAGLNAEIINLDPEADAAQIEQKNQEIADRNVALLNYYKLNLKNLIADYINFNAVAKSNKEEKIAENYLVGSIKVDIAYYSELVDNATSAEISSVEPIKVSLNGTAGCLDVKNKQATNEALKKADEATDVYLIGALYLLQAEIRLTDLEPIVFKAKNFGDFLSHLWNNLFVFPIAWLLQAISKLCGGYYVFGLIITTLLVRAAGWPIYANSNNMSQKMAEIQPEIQKIQEKYAGRNDPESQRMMQMEQAQVYRKNKVGFGGCLMPFLQMPIFMAVFRAISRLPYTKAIEGTRYTLNWGNEIKSNLFGIDLFQDRSGGVLPQQLIGVIVLIILVVGTQVLSQLLMQRRQKKAQEKKQEDIPLYKRQSVDQTNNQSQKTMQYMMWFMIIMMGTFVWSSKAGLGLYWLIGNLFSMLQMAINSKQQEKKAEKERNKKNIYTVNR